MCDSHLKNCPASPDADFPRPAPSDVSLLLALGVKFIGVVPLTDAKETEVTLDSRRRGHISLNITTETLPMCFWLCPHQMVSECVRATQDYFDLGHGMLVNLQTTD